MPLHASPCQNSSPRVVICILNWNGWQDTLECLDSVRKLNDPNYLTVVIDNGSRDDSAERIKVWAEQNLGSGRVLADYRRETALKGGEAQTEQALERTPPPARLVLIRNEENLGFTGGNNVAIRYALQRLQPADYVLLLNNDAFLERDSLTRLLEAGQASGAGIVGAPLRDVKSGEIEFTGFDDSVTVTRQLFFPLGRSPHAVPDSEKEFQGQSWVPGGAMLIGRSVLQDVYRLCGRYLDDRFFLYSEEMEFCARARKIGYSTVMANRAVIYHVWGGSSGGQVSPIPIYYMNRNRIFLARSFLASPWRAAFHLANAAICLGRILNGLAKHRHGWAFAIFWGTVDGYRGIGGKWRYHDREARRGFDG